MFLQSKLFFFFATNSDIIDAIHKRGCGTAATYPLMAILRSLFFSRNAITKWLNSLNKLKIQLAGLFLDTSQMPHRNKSMTAQPRHSHCLFAFPAVYCEMRFIATLFSWMRNSLQLFLALIQKDKLEGCLEEKVLRRLFVKKWRRSTVLPLPAFFPPH